MKKKLLISALFMTVVIVMAIGFMACNSDGGKAPDDIRYDGTSITWNNVKGAEYYTVSIDDGPDYTTYVNSYPYDPTGDFSVTVTSFAKNKEKSASASFRLLDTIDDVKVADDGSVSWSPVATATAYMLFVSEDEVEVYDTNYSSLPTGRNLVVKVRPIVKGNDSFCSVWSDEEGIYIYDAPTNLKYDDEKNEISWNGASSDYVISINGTEYNVVGAKSYSYQPALVDFEIRVKSLGDHEKTYDSSYVSDSYHYLDTIKNISVEDGILVWEEISGASYYKLRLLQNGSWSNAQKVTTNSYADMATGTTYIVEIMPANDDGNYFSEWSAQKTIYILPAPNSYWNSNYTASGLSESYNFYWNAVSGAGSYMVKITYSGDSSPTTATTTNTYYGAKYDQVGTYTLEVKAQAGTGDIYYDSKYSTPITVTRLSAPQMQSVESDAGSFASGFTVYYSGVSGASSYSLYEEDTQVVSGATASYISYANIGTPQNGNQITYKLASNGSAYDSGKRSVVLGSVLDESCAFTITVLSTPTNLTMSGYTLGWNQVSGASYGYLVAYGGSVFLPASSSQDLSSLGTGTYTVTVCARGDGAQILASTYSNGVTIQRLSAPTVSSITSDENGTLTFTQVSGATSYSVYIDDSDTPITDTNYNNMYNYIQTSGSTVSMTADANSWNTGSTVYYMTSVRSASKQFVKLEAPTFSDQSVVATDGRMIWSAPSNVGTEYTPTYTIYQNQTNITVGTETTTSLDISSWEAGSYTVYIRAVGNTTYYVDSDLSNAITFTKLGKPTLTVDSTEKMYTWNLVTSAEYYVINLGNGVDVTVAQPSSGNTVTYTPNFTTQGTYNVTLRAIGNGVTTVSSLTETRQQTVSQLSVPVISGAAYSEEYVKLGQGYFNITLQTDVQNAYGYRVYTGGTYYDNVTGTGNSDIRSNVINNTGAVQIYVVALGGVFGSTGDFYIDSQNSTTTTRTLLSSPNAGSIVRDTNNNVSWTAVTGASSYSVTIKIGNDYTKTVTASSWSLNINEYLTESAASGTVTVEITIQAVGAGTYVTSAPSETASFTFSLPVSS